MTIQDSQKALDQQVTRAPLPIDAGAGAGDDASPFDRLVANTAATSPYLCRLINREAEWLEGIRQASPERTLDALIAEMRAEADEAADLARCGVALRRGKNRAALLIALADLGGVWPLQQVTLALSDFADAAVGAGLRWLLRQELVRERLPGMTIDDLDSGAGYVVLAMGKHGARELNYSSDIDIICLFDEARFDPGDFAEAKARYIRVTRDLVKLLSENTDFGYVLRTDLRLRPAPSTTPVCIAMEAAERYYESVGRTWERAAHIKARAVAGDIAAGEAYLDRLTPFVWRRHLDFATVEETHEMLRKIRETKRRFAQAEIAGADVKVSPGGIREIEFSAQTRQLIHGGRNPSLRASGTLEALEALARGNIISSETARQFSEDYIAHRTLEHRLQMIEDAQTHTIPNGVEGRRRVAALMGTDDLGAWEREIGERMKRVHRLAEDFFDPGEVHKGAEAPPRPAAPEDLAHLGFARPDDTARLVARWRSGEIAATRSDRSHSLYMSLEPRILQLLAEAADPDQAAAECDRFLSGLPAGVQVFSLFKSNPHLLDLIVRICAIAPKLAAHLGRNPQTLDALLDQGFYDRLPGVAALSTDLEARLAKEEDYERVLDLVRRWARELHFRIGVQVLTGMAGTEEAGHAFSAVAEAAILGLMPHVTEEFARRHGPPPGRGLALLAMGKLGSAEMTASSDLDLIIVYDPQDEEASTGKKPLMPRVYYTRLTQALVAAITAPTAEGRLFEVDMRLRPSGSQGPVAVALNSFRNYQQNDAWVWEHMALTRARVIGGNPDLAAEMEEVISTVLKARQGQEAVLTEAREMLTRIENARPRGTPDPWNLKEVPGGIKEIEFLAQTGVLYNGVAIGRRATDSLPMLADTGWLSTADAKILVDTLDLMTSLQQIERVALDKPLSRRMIGPGLGKLLTDTGRVDGLDELEALLDESQSQAASIVARRFEAT
ncbi:bifunctional [glutamine synthetase] adenylyltransferase/[glutamine synthetase]-adenylyl-L-tyrosine phosphorylase [Rhodobacteraceae bacterium NNCM2]|nr:bifunctional [glutamine synthetase] adenylyltransferase/[glutamine synthetase]-adenylyl-L-tyrosine phosphorylase [Coraliihabitans acroporae]